MKLSLIIPSIWRIERASKLFEIILRDMRKSDELIVATDKEGRKAFRKQFGKDRRFRCFVSETEGYWRVMNESLVKARRITFLYTADDIVPHDGWLEIAREAFEKNFPDGLGIVGMNDMIVGDATCGHAITTPKFLYVMFGHPYFPVEFRHLYLDTLIADRAKTLKRFYYAYNAITEHMHYSVKKSQKDALNHRNETGDDKPIKDAMDQNWKQGEWERAKKRLAELGGEEYEIKNVTVPYKFKPAPTPFSFPVHVEHPIQRGKQSKDQHIQSRKK